MKASFRAIFASIFAVCSLAAAPGAVPTTLPDWKIELVAASPAIKHPSVVCSAPDGRIFVAEDPMDISSPHADAQEGRIVCFHPDGRSTVFAEKLYAIFGMQYLEGKLYVLHNPKFSVFIDRAGVAGERVDLIEQTNPNPWALDWNDHVPANFRLAMDGYFYVAVGDKGIYGAKGRDGRGVDLHGGGILRLRPDGTGMEVFCRGVRNILDVAMNEEDDFFTYDNTDEQQWMGRLTHMVDGGFYGYPYDFIPRQSYTLWMMADYGAGAATGTLCYNEDALPPAYHGNLFLADFGKRQVMRVVLARAGGSFAATQKTDMFPDPPPDFRPVGIGWSSDGLSMLICDWQHRDVKEDVAVGRLWKMTFTGASKAAPKPSWYVPAAMGAVFTASADDLLQALDHPSHQVRITAQRRLAERARNSSPPRDQLRASSPTKELIALLENSRAPSRARRHALWALDGMDAGVAARPEIIRVVADPDASLRRQALRQLGGHGGTNAVEVIAERLADAEPSVRFQAATALGRSAAWPAVAPLITALNEKDFFARYAVFTALNRIGRAHKEAWPDIVAALQGDNVQIREGAEFSLRDTYDVELVDELSRCASDAKVMAEVRRTTLRLLAALALQPEPWRGEWWAYHPVNAPPPLRTVEWTGTPIVMAALLNNLRDPEASIRLAAVQGLRACRRSESAPRLRELLRDEPLVAVQEAVVEALGVFGDAESAPLVNGILQSRKPSSLLPSAIEAAATIGGEALTQSLLELLQDEEGGTNVTIRVIAALGKLRATNAGVSLVQRLTHEDAGVRAAVANALVRIGGEAALSPVLALAEKPGAAPSVDAIMVLGKLRNKAAVPALLKLFERSSVRDEVIEALTRIPDPRALLPYLQGLGSKNAARREQSRNAISAIQDQVLSLIEPQVDKLDPELIAELRTVYEKNAAARKGNLFTVNVPLRGPDDYAQFARDHPGDAARGRSIFMNENGVACIKCHTLGEQGRPLGPDLSNIGTQFDKTALMESILYPSRVMREGYNQVMLDTVDDDVVSGLFKGESADEVHLLDASGQLVRVAKKQIKNRRTSQLSLMPEGLHSGLTLSEFADLIAYLESLKLPNK